MKFTHQVTLNSSITSKIEIPGLSQECSELYDSLDSGPPIRDPGVGSIPVYQNIAFRALTANQIPQSWRREFSERTLCFGINTKYNIGIVSSSIYKMLSSCCCVMATDIFLNEWSLLHRFLKKCEASYSSSFGKIGVQTIDIVLNNKQTYDFVGET